MLTKLFANLSVIISMLLGGYVAHAQLESMDIGDAADTPGSTEITEDGMITVMASGSDIWNEADGFRFVYTSHRGDFDTQVHLISLETITEWTKAAIMARQSVAADSEHVIATVTGGGASGSQLTWRKGGANNETADLAPGPWKEGGWLRLTRKGDEFQGFISQDGQSWLDIGSQTLVMTDPILVGLAVTALASGTLVTAVFEDFTIDGVDVIAAVEPEGKLAVTWGKIKQR